MATLLYENGISFASGAASITLTAAQAPAGSMVIVDYMDSASIPGASAISGFTLLDQAQSSNSGVLLNDATFYAILGSAGVTITTTDTSSSTKFLNVFVITEHDNLAPKFSHGGSGNTTTQGNPSAGSLSADNAGAYLFGFGSTNVPKTTSINGMSPTNGNTPADRGSYRCSRFSQAISSAGAIGAKTLTVTSATSPQRANIMTVLVGTTTTLSRSSSDSASNIDSATINASSTQSDTETSTESASVSATLSSNDSFISTDTATASVNQLVSDSFTNTDQVSAVQIFSVIDSVTYTDIASIVASLNINDSALHTDQATIYSILNVSDSAIHTDTSIIGTIVSDNGTHTDSNSVAPMINPTDSGIHLDVFSILATLSRSDNATHSDSVQATIIQTVNDNATHTDTVTINIVINETHTSIDTLNSYSNINAIDNFTTTDLIGKLKTEFFYEDQINYSVPIFIKPSKPQRVIAQNVFTREFFHWDVPLQNPELTFRYTAPNSFKATLKDDVKYLTDVSSKFVEDATFLHYEEDGVIRQTTILMPFIDDKGNQMRQIEGIGFSDLPNRRYYQGPPVEFVYADPMTIVRYLWAWCLVGQGIQDYVFIKIPSNVITPVRIGTPKKNVSFTTSTGQNVDFDSGPIDYNAWEVSNVGEELNKLYKETPIEYREESIWDANHTDIYTTVGYKYPRIGAARNNTFWRDGENIIETDPEYVSNRYPRSVTVVGAGEGPTAIRATCAFLNPVKRIPYDLVLENEDIQSNQRAFDIAKFELLRLYRSRYSIKSITVDTTHPNAKLGTWAEGDDIYPETYVRNVGRVADWHRITEYTYYPANSRRAVLQLAPSASFGYGANLEVAN